MMEADRAEALASVLDVVPPVRHAFGYGSGVFAQPSPSDAPVDDDAARRASGRAATPSGAVADFVFVVESPRRWHAENMARNPTHYAPHVRLLGPTFAASLAESVGAGVHYNTLLPWNLPTNPLGFTAYKYGVVSADAARDDLLHWRHLFLAGRMQKPVASLGRPDPDVAAAVDVNLRAALAAALLVLPERFPLENLHRALCGLSYRGDVRVALGAEDARKIERIARGSAGALERLYRPATDALADSPVGLRPAEASGREGAWWGQDKGEGARATLLAALPRRALSAMGAPIEGGAEEAAEALARKGGDVGAAAMAFAERTVRWSSARQTLASALVTSPDKAVRYVAAKVWKSVASRVPR